MSQLKQYRGKLAIAEIAAGMNAAADNARRLASDAAILLDAGRYPSAASLATLAIEEAGKVSILRGMALSRDEKELRAAWGDYRHHKAKNGAWILPTLAAAGARRLDQLKPAVAHDEEHNDILDTIKQLGFYTDCYGDNHHWSQPKDVIEIRLAQQLVETADLLSRKNNATVRELELWIEHIGPVWMTEEMPYALVRWQAAMVAEGLSDTSVERMEAFVLGDGLTSK